MMVMQSEALSFDIDPDQTVREALLAGEEHGLKRCRNPVCGDEQAGVVTLSHVSLTATHPWADLVCRSC
jgi:hypothetical protein